MRRFLLILCLILSAVNVSAQERVLRVDGFPVVIQYLEADQKVADKVSSVAADAIPRLLSELGLSRMTQVNVVLISDMDAFRRQQNVRLPSWGVAFALMGNQIMIVDVRRATNAMNTLEKVIPHELSHLLVAQRVGEVALPVWFVEGLAMWQAREWSLLEHWRLMEAVWGRRALTLAHIRDRLPAGEAQARDAYRIAYVGFTERFGDEIGLVPAFLDQVVSSEDFAVAFEEFWGETEIDYYTRSAHALDRKYRSGLLLFQTGPLFTLMAFLFLFVILRLYIRNRRNLKKMEDNESWPDARA